MKRSHQLRHVPVSNEDGLPIDPDGEREFERRANLKAGRAPKPKPMEHYLPAMMARYGHLRRR